VTPVELAARNNASRQALYNLTRSVGAVLLSAWTSTVTAADDAALEAWLVRSVPLVQSGQRSAALVSARAAWTLLASSDGVSATMSAVVPKLVTAETPWQSSPMLRLRSLLAEDAPWDVAKADSGAYAQMLASGDLNSAAREGGDQAVEQLAEEVDGPIAWAKVAAPDCCAFCQRSAGQLYRAAGNVPMHSGDHCGYQPVTMNTPGHNKYSNSRTIFK
jgi:hypothetical protein